jgi:methyltransferase (TIGR00027 family)
MPEPVITHISDTARWVAAYRASESERPDAIFKDPLARRLAGERGLDIARQMKRAVRFTWPMVVRTRLIDDLIATAIADGADRVVNLAAGLDSRPYRLPLPPSLRWIEADLPAMVDEKERLLADEKPACQLTRERVDLADSAARAAFLDRALDGAARALVITEGLLVYLEPDAVRALGRDLHARAGVAWWLIDLSGPGVLRMMQRRTNPMLGANAQMKFGPAEGVAFFKPLGWLAEDVRSLFRAALDFHRAPWFFRLFSLFPEPNPENPGKRPWGAVVRLRRAP